jgi:hypothetical protein
MISVRHLNQPIVKHVPKRTEADYIIKRDTLDMLDKLAGKLPKFNHILFPSNNIMHKHNSKLLSLLLMIVLSLCISCRQPDVKQPQSYQTNDMFIRDLSDTTIPEFKRFKIDTAKLRKAALTNKADLKGRIYKY